MSIEVKNLSKSYGLFRALDNVNLKVEDGELVALLGPSGSGKTTLLRIIAGLDVADTGEVLMGGADASRLQVRERKVGFVFQHYALFRHMTVFENVAFGLRVRPKPVRLAPEEIRRRVMQLLELVHLDRFHDRYPHQLSGGQRQRVALARSLAVEPQLLLLDEPFGALDAKVRKELRRWLRRLHDDIHITSIFVTHDQEEAMEVADRVVVMNQGKIEQMGTPEEVYHRPSNGFVYDFLGNYNEFAGWRDETGGLHLTEDDVYESRPTQNALPEKKSGFIAAAMNFMRGAKTASAPRQTISKPNAALGAKGKPVRVFARPHEMFVARAPEGEHHYIPVILTHLNPAGPLAKLELERQNGSIIQAEIPKAIVDLLELKKGDKLFVRPKNVRIFE